VAVRPEVRIIAGTSRDLEEEVRAGRFLEGLAACLGACVITVPPLREHREDIPSLVALFMARYNRTLGKAIVTVSDRTMELLMARDWPGNVKELKGVIELAMIMSKGSSLELPERLHPQPE
jgi:DNA-binding NtrC family response regulator